MHNPTLVTGASTGIGRAIAQRLLNAGTTVFAAARTEADLAPLAAAHPDTCMPLRLDVTEPDSIAAAAAKLRATLGTATLRGLVNNAGIALGGPLELQPMAEIRAVLEVNLFGAIAVTQAMLPLLGTDPARTGAKGRIVNISSVGGRIAPPFLGAYAISKHALEAFSHALRRELLIFGIDVILVAPGAVATPIWDKAERQPETPYLGTRYETALRRFQRGMLEGGRKGLPADKIAETVQNALFAKSPRARYAVVPNRLVNWSIPVSLPHRTLDRLIGKRLGLSSG